MKKSTMDIIRLIVMLLTLGLGAFFLIKYASWQVFVGVFLLIWSNNVSLRINKEMK